MSKESLDNIDAKLSEMLTNSTRIFDISMNALLGDTNLDSVRDDLYDTDKSINELHREVRREMIIHSAVNSRNLDIPLLLSYMTMSKDIERIGDYCKNLFEIAETGNTFAKGDDLDSYIELRNDIGKLAPGYGADIAAFNCRNIDFAGAEWDLLAGLLFCGSNKASYTIINGKVIVDQGQLVTMDMQKLLENHRALTRDLMDKS